MIEVHVAIDDQPNDVGESGIPWLALIETTIVNNTVLSVDRNWDFIVCEPFIPDENFTGHWIRQGLWLSGEEARFIVYGGSLAHLEPLDGRIFTQATVGAFTFFTQHLWHTFLSLIQAH